MTDALIFKHEDEADGMPMGPVWIRRGGEQRNYRDHATMTSPVSGEPVAQWMLLDAAEDAARQERLPLEQV